MYKKYIYILIFSSILPFIILLMMNILLDPLGYLNTGILKKEFQVNERYRKIEYLKENHNKYNSYLLGSSRIGTTDPAIIEKYIQDSNFYNMTVSGATIYDYELFVKYFIKNNYEIKNIYLQIDIYENLFSFAQAGYLSQQHPDLLKENKIRYLLKYIFSFHKENIYELIKINFSTSENKLYDWYNTGMWLRPDREKDINIDYKKYENNEPTFGLSKNPIKRINESFEANFAALERLIRLCKDNNINLIIFTTPHNKNMMQQIDMDEYINFLRRLSSITDFWDFSTLNKITEDNYYYYEWSHYRPIVSELIAKRIFNDNPINDFGIYTINGNIDKQLKKLSSSLYTDVFTSNIPLVYDKAFYVLERDSYGYFRWTKSNSKINFLVDFSQGKISLDLMCLAFSRKLIVKLNNNIVYNNYIEPNKMNKIIIDTSYFIKNKENILTIESEGKAIIPKEFIENSNDSRELLFLLRNIYIEKDISND